MNRILRVLRAKATVKHIWSEDAGCGHDYQISRQYFYRLMQQTFRD